MNNDIWKETMVEQKVTYTLEINGKFIIAILNHYQDYDTIICNT